MSTRIYGDATPFAQRSNHPTARNASFRDVSGYDASTNVKRKCPSCGVWGRKGSRCALCSAKIPAPQPLGGGGVLCERPVNTAALNSAKTPTRLLIRDPSTSGTPSRTQGVRRATTPTATSRSQRSTSSQAVASGASQTRGSTERAVSIDTISAPSTGSHTPRRTAATDATTLSLRGFLARASGESSRKQDVPIEARLHPTMATMMNVPPPLPRNHVGHDVQMELALLAAAAAEADSAGQHFRPRPHVTPRGVAENSAAAGGASRSISPAFSLPTFGNGIFSNDVARSATPVSQFYSTTQSGDLTANLAQRAVVAAMRDTRVRCRTCGAWVHPSTICVLCRSHAPPPPRIL